MNWSIPYLLLVTVTSLKTAASEATIDAGQYHTCAVRVDGLAECWGRNDFGSADLPDQYARKAIDICAGDFHSCIVIERNNGELVCFGRADEGQINPPDKYGPGNKTSIAAVSCGAYHTLALHRDGRVIAFGGGPKRELSNKQYNQSLVPEQLEGQTVVAVSAGSYHSIALTELGDLVAWGYNGDGQLNISSDFMRGVAQVSAGGFHTCVLRNDSMAACFGKNSEGQLEIPEAFSSNVAMVSAGGFHTCIVNNDRDMACFGLNTDNQTDIPEDFQSDISMVSCSGTHCYAVRTDGTVGAWGRSSDGQTETPASFNNLLEILAPPPAEPPSEGDGHQGGRSSPSTNPPPPSPESNESSSTIIIVGAALGAGVAVLVVLLALWAALRWRSGRKQARRLQRPIMLADLLVTSNNPLATRYIGEFILYKVAKGTQGSINSGKGLPSGSDVFPPNDSHGDSNGPPMGTTFYYGNAVPRSCSSYGSSSNPSQLALHNSECPGSPNIAAPRAASNGAGPQAQMIDATQVQMCRDEHGELCLLGRGASAVVYKGVYQGEYVAVKMMSLMPDARGRPGIRIDRVRHEVDVLCRLNGQEGVLRLLGFATGDVVWMLVTEYMAGGSLADVLHGRGQAVKEHFLWRNSGAKVMLAAAKGLANIHSLKIIHLDLKPHNILLDEEGGPRIADMGLAKVQAKTLETAHGGTLAYTPPEQLSGRVTDRADVYSFGVMLWEVVTGERPPMSHDERRTPRVPEECSEGMVQLLDSCLKIDPSARPCAQQLVAWLAALVEEKDQGGHEVAAGAPQQGSCSGSKPPMGSPHDDGNGLLGTSFYSIGTPASTSMCPPTSSSYYDNNPPNSS